HQMRHVSTIWGGLHATVWTRRPYVIGPLQSWTAPRKRSVPGVSIALLWTRSGAGWRRDISRPTILFPSSSERKQYRGHCAISQTYSDLCAKPPFRCQLSPLYGCPKMLICLFWVVDSSSLERFRRVAPIDHSGATVFGPLTFTLPGGPDGSPRPSRISGLRRAPNARFRYFRYGCP